MLPLTGSELAEIVRGEILNGRDTLLGNVSIDTRSLKPGDLFIPLKGDRYDGHNFICTALEKGARGFLVEYRRRAIIEELERSLSDELAVITVENGLLALQVIAQHIRKVLSTQVVGITGSTGKTSTKDMIVGILSQSKKVVSSTESYNNEIGVPLTVLKAERDTEVIVVEMAMRGLGQITELARIARPTVGLVTNVGKSHFELLGSEERIGEAKGELVKAIPEEGIMVLNADDLWTERLKRMAVCPVISYGLSPSAEIRALDIYLEKGRPSFTLRTPVGKSVINLPVLGIYNVYNALAASTVALQLGGKLEDVKSGLENCQISKMRMECFTSADGVTVLNDSYNANPASMEAALQTLRDVAAESRKIAVLGDMLELGAISEKSHYQIGETVYKIGVNILITIGKNSRYIAEGAIRKGMRQDNVFICQNLDKARSLLNSQLKAGDVVLIKASRALRMEDVVDSIVNL